MVILFVNINDDQGRWKNYITNKNLKGINLFANQKQSEELFASYCFNSIPAYVLIDKKGNIINVNADGPDSVLSSILDALK